MSYKFFVDQGLGGAIVVCPAISETFTEMPGYDGVYNLRISRDNWTLSCGAQAVWELMDSLTDEYNVDTNRIYGSGQSMGGMTVMAMAAHRDNYFAALLPLSCKWGTNFNKEVEFNGQTYYNAPADNILYYSTAGENNEYKIIFHDLAGVDVESADMYLDENTRVEARNAIVNELVGRDSALGIRQIDLSGNVGHMSAWFYGHSTSASYEWLARQTRESEMAREKLDLNKPFERADVQLEDDFHVYERGRDGTVTYIPTGKPGAGTIGYNSGCSALGRNAKLDPGWTA